MSSKNGASNSIHSTINTCAFWDGSGGVMVGQLNMNLAHDGCKLQAGNIVQLHTFTPLTYEMLPCNCHPCLF